MEEINELIEQRIKKLDELKALGVEPFGGSFDIKDYAEDLINKHGSTAKEELEASPVQCVIAGRIIMMRDFGKAAFAHVQDSTAKIQIYFRKDILNEKYSVVKKLDIGDIIGISGKLFRTRTNELTIEVDDFTFLTKSLRPLPEKWHGLKDIETRYRQRYVDLIVNPEVKETFKKRSTIIKAVRDFLETKGFIEVETPMMHQIPGGAAARPFKTHHNALDIELYLRIAPELYLKRLLVGGYEKVYELNKNFRNEGISTKHNPEFSMLEFYIAYKDYNYLMSLTEELISYAAEKTLGTLKVSFGDEDIDFTPPWDRMPFLDSLTQKGVPADIMNDIDKAAAWAKANKIGIDKGASLGKVLDEIFKEKVEPYLIQPTFIIDYPVELSPLAKRKKDSPGLVERFELFVSGREIANAFSELNDPMDQRERFQRQVEAKEKGDEETMWMDEDFIRALEHGMPPAAGEGIGIDRLVMLLTNSQSIRDVILFPQLKPEA
ncbi:MAG: lysine--tRNA ligase [Nitrospirae bacterium CG_4_10_14_3_um_filter_44_29]|nr:lysine--tRNA ligase [Nitrospirota bacterium]OIO31943.1 MAG: lysine--tRNA ligase [Nitrospirae bacterium CG1_02_44_142]PIP69449.1 MAG: lysine--tRNA ligase [Nitrospirae bacterium CG22_combo_CG10-13_8_21_14_all_44_11]PIV42646.1 MAG: lysine--tRNA ligase [Nitrospirae bacterium CG02_land_8_20_14_3_00_44_33]PIV65422.1 MAG: lysine--tRNA ligase [Nitrospirae bacterium CG01_land_8_20_14_3_00_44_22]PIX87773.1 MAG: lysine--tRNA ligase [Nitrospirae bacterium CG_4_10_14_3_um_filter_44_29]PJA82997.1 MAG: l